MKHRNRVPKFEVGGGIFSALTGEGSYDPKQYFPQLQYVPAQQFNIPLEVFQKAQAGIDSVYASLDKKRAALMPDKEELDKIKKELVGHNSQVGGISKEFEKAYANLLEKQGSDPNYVFSRQGRSHISHVNSILSQEKINGLKNDFEASKKMLDKAIGKGTLGNVFVDKNTFFVRDVNNPANISQVTPEQYAAKPEAFRKQFVPMTQKDVYDFHNERTQYGFKDYITFGDQYDMKDVQNEINNGFSELGHYERSTLQDGLGSLGVDINKPNVLNQIINKTRHNTKQLKEALGLITHTLSQKSKDAILSDMLAKNYDPKQFETYVENWLSGEANKRWDFSKDDGNNISALPSGLGGGKDDKIKEDWWQTNVKGLGEYHQWDDDTVTVDVPDPKNPSKIKKDDVPVKTFRFLNEDSYADVKNPNPGAPYTSTVLVNGTMVNLSGVHNVRDENRIEGVVMVPKVIPDPKDPKKTIQKLNPDGSLDASYYLKKVLVVSGDGNDVKKAFMVNSTDPETGETTKKSLFETGWDNRTGTGTAAGVQKKHYTNQQMSDLNLPLDSRWYGMDNEVYEITVLEPVTYSRVSQVVHKDSRAKNLGQDSEDKLRQANEAAERQRIFDATVSGSTKPK